MSLVSQLQSDLVLARGLREGMGGLILRVQMEEGRVGHSSEVEELNCHINAVKCNEKVIRMAFVIIRYHRLSFRNLSKVRELFSERNLYIRSGGSVQNWLTDAAMASSITDLWLKEVDMGSNVLTYPPISNKDIVSFLLAPISYPTKSESLFSMIIHFLLTCIVVTFPDAAETGAGLRGFLQVFSDDVCAAVGLSFGLKTAMLPLWAISTCVLRAGVDHLVVTRCKLPILVLETCARVLLVDGELDASYFISSQIIHEKDASIEAVVMHGLVSVLRRPESFIIEWVEFVRNCCMLRSNSAFVRRSVARCISRWAADTGRLYFILESSLGHIVIYHKSQRIYSYLLLGD